MKGDLSGYDLVVRSKNNVLIETLVAGQLRLPVVAEPRYTIKQETLDTNIDILHPGVLILTKMKRWYHQRESTRPQTIAKNLSDKEDLDFMVSWLAGHDMTIEFEQYKANMAKDEL